MGAPVSDCNKDYGSTSDFVCQCATLPSLGTCKPNLLSSKIYNLGFALLTMMQLKTGQFCWSYINWRRQARQAIHCKAKDIQGKEAFNTLFIFGMSKEAEGKGCFTLTKQTVDIQTTLDCTGDINIKDFPIYPANAKTGANTAHMCEGAHGPSTYRLFPKRHTLGFEVAKDKCEKLGQGWSLAVTVTPERQIFLARLNAERLDNTDNGGLPSKDKPFWVGLKRMTAMDSASGKDQRVATLDGQCWSPRDHGGLCNAVSAGDCLQYTADGSNCKYASASCADPHPFVCERTTAPRSGAPCPTPCPSDDSQPIAKRCQCAPGSNADECGAGNYCVGGKCQANPPPTPCPSNDSTASQPIAKRCQCA